MLPDELLQLVGHKLDLASVLALATACRRFYEVLLGDHIYRPKLQARLGLVACAGAGITSAVRLLLARGDVPAEDLRAAAKRAACGGHADTMRALLTDPAVRAITDALLAAAVGYGRAPVVAVLCPGSSSAAIKKALFAAIANRDTHAAVVLAPHAAYLASAVRVAVRSGAGELARTLLASGVRLSRVEARACVAEAARRGDAAVARAVIRAGDLPESCWPECARLARLPDGCPGP